MTSSIRYCQACTAVIPANPTLLCACFFSAHHPGTEIHHFQVWNNALSKQKCLKTENKCLGKDGCGCSASRCLEDYSQPVGSRRESTAQVMSLKNGLQIA